MRYRLSIVLMVSSLVLLAGFLSLYLKKAWDEALGALRKETSLLFIQAVQNIEGELLDDLILKKFTSPDSNLILQWSNQVRHKDVDSVNVLAFVGQDPLPAKKDSTFSIRVKRDQLNTDASQIEGSLSLVISINELSNPDSLGTVPLQKRQDIQQLLKERFLQTAKAANLPGTFQVLRWEDDTLAAEKWIPTGNYTDLGTGESFKAAISDYQPYVWKKIAPEIIFSVLLFAFVALAFYTTLQNLRTQQRLTDLKNDFIQNMSHELKTPIATVGVAIEALRDFNARENPERLKEYLDISKSELGRLNLLIEKVMHVTRLEQPTALLQFDALDLKVLVQETIQAMKLQLEKTGAQLQLETHGDNFEIEGDRFHLAGVVYNLLDNAIKYSQGQPMIVIGLEAKEDQVILAVSDQGIGISSIHQSRIFDKFFRVPTGNQHNIKGYGLGLHYVAMVVKKHGGRMVLESEEGQGTLFNITWNRKIGA
ncbi:MAG TPA: HAMP domain-containing sensor histidine kinase [Saprospiraceae bacterium]|nr:HAMP domain-containing sensor histidine kinase [Saprospiraceae bacterium]HMQ81921.1 HAMP domain-containing sensor histidine kinase [Saprospiraceae bacterium]